MGLWVVVVIIVVVTGLVPSVILTRGPAILLVLVAAGIFRTKSNHNESHLLRTGIGMGFPSRSGVHSKVVEVV